MGPGRQGSEAPRGWLDGLLPRGLSLRCAREPGSPEPPVVRGQDVARRHRGDLQPGRAIWLAAWIAGAEQFLGAARGGEVSAEHGPRKISGRGPHPLSPPRRQGVGAAGHVTVALLQITWRIPRNKVSFARL